MSQYKLSMARMSRPLDGGGVADQQQPPAENDEQQHEGGEPVRKAPLHVLSSDAEGDGNGESCTVTQHDHPAIITNPIVAYLRPHADFILMPVLPLCWCLLLVSTLSRDDLLSAWAMPLLGIGSATLANAVPGEY